MKSCWCKASWNGGAFARQHSALNFARRKHVGVKASCHRYTGFGAETSVLSKLLVSALFGHCHFRTQKKRVSMHLLHNCMVSRHAGFLHRCLYQCLLDFTWAQKPPNIPGSKQRDDSLRYLVPLSPCSRWRVPFRRFFEIPSHLGHSLTNRLFNRRNHLEIWIVESAKFRLWRCLQRFGDLDAMLWCRCAG